jgi:DNA relaxase NicK
MIPWQLFQGLDDFLRHNYPDDYHYTRIDLAFDQMPFTPQDIEDAISRGQITSSAKRETLKVYRSPFEKRDDGGIGTHTVEYGSRMSERMIRAYDRRGFTRLELELKMRRADLVAKQLLSASEVAEWWPIMISHLRDYIDFNADWWDEFVNGIGRARAIVSSPKERTAESMTSWLEKSVAVTLSVIHDMRPDYFLKDLIRQGRMKRGTRFDDLLADAQPQFDFYDELGRRVWKKAEEEDTKKKDGEHE